MNIVRTLFFPGVPYPLAVIWHFILGGFGGFLIALAIGTNAGSYTTGLFGGGVGVVLGFIVWLMVRKADLNKRG